MVAQVSAPSPKFSRVPQTPRLLTQSPLATLGSWVWERKEPGSIFSAGLAQERQGRLRWEGVPWVGAMPALWGLREPPRSWAQAQRGELSQVCHIPPPAVTAQEKLPANPKRPGSL